MISYPNAAILKYSMQIFRSHIFRFLCLAQEGTYVLKVQLAWTQVGPAVVHCCLMYLWYCHWILQFTTNIYFQFISYWFLFNQVYKASNSFLQIKMANAVGWLVCFSTICFCHVLNPHILLNLQYIDVLASFSTKLLIYVSLVTVAFCISICSITSFTVAEGYSLFLLTTTLISKSHVVYDQYTNFTVNLHLYLRFCIISRDWSTRGVSDILGENEFYTSF